MPKPFDVPTFLTQLRAKGCALGEPLKYFATTDSTNSQAKAAARAGATHGSCFVADEQTAGRGRRGRQWVAAARDSLLFSVVLRPRLEPEKVHALTLVAGLGVRDGLSRHCGAALKIKWPNDIVADQGASSKRKLAGILTESEWPSHSTQGPTLVLGVGVNIETEVFPEELRDIATSVRLLQTAPSNRAGTGRIAREADAALSAANKLPSSAEVATTSREPILVDLLVGIASRLSRYEREGVGPMVADLASCDALSARAIAVDGVTGIARGIDGQGRLLFEENGAVRAVGSGTVEWR